jgi:hypothetical protein
MAGAAVQTEPFSEMATMGVDDATPHSFEDTQISNQPLPTESDRDLLDKYTELEMPPLDAHVINHNGRLFCAWADDPLCSHAESSRTTARLVAHPQRPFLLGI